MHFIFAFLAIAVAVQASPVPIPQAVTAVIAPLEAMPAGFAATFMGSFGIAAQNLSAPVAIMKRQVSQISE